MHYLDWNRLNKTFYLLDTFRGLDERFISEEERRDGILERNEHHLKIDFYTTDSHPVRRNFSEWKNVRIVEGRSRDPGSGRFPAGRLSSSGPELLPARGRRREFFWDRLVPGGLVLMDD